MEITKELLAAGASQRGGFSKQQIALLGISWPLQRGWKKSIIGGVISDEAAEEFVSLSDQHRGGHFCNIEQELVETEFFSLQR